MRIAIWHNLPSGGGKRALYYHIKGLLQRGHEVEVWCPPTADNNYLPLGDLVTEHVLPFEWLPSNGRSRISRMFADYGNRVSKIEAMDRHCRICADEINARGFDILLVNPCALFRVSSIGRYVDIPAVIYLQEPYRWLYESLPQLPWVALAPRHGNKGTIGYLKQYLKDLIRVQGLRVQVREELINARAFDAILVNSLFSRESILRAYGIESQVCYLGVDAQFFNPNGFPKSGYVIGLGGIYIGKGVDRAIRAIASIDESNRPNLIWVGDFVSDGYRAEVENLAKQLKVNISFQIRVSDERLIKLLSRATLMIYTSRLEPFGFAPLEANACETPVVAIAEGGVRETIHNGVNGILVENDDPIALGNAVLRLLGDPTLARQMGRRGREYVVENWSWEQAVDRLEAYLHQYAQRTER